MSKAYPNVPNRGPIPITGASSFPLTYNPIPIGWVQVVSAGSGGLVVKDEAGVSQTYAGLVAGETIYGPFTEVTSMTLTSAFVGDGQPPVPANTSTAALFTDGTTNQGVLELRPSDFYLFTGAPLAAFSNGASAVPGSSLTDSKLFCIRWNNNATLNAITASFVMPPDVDITQNMTMHFRASKTGATSGDAPTFLTTWWNQTDGALDDAASDAGGTSSAMSGTATAKTVQNVTLTILAANLAAYPASVTISVKPTDGTLGTDDLNLLGVTIQYKRKLLTS